MRDVAGRLAKILVDTGSLKLGRFRLSSGGYSSVYIDLRTIPFHPKSFREVLEMAADIVKSMQVDALAGVATGGIPWSTGLGLLLEIPSTYVRPREKGHGTSRRVEADVDGMRVLVIDDVATTGSSILRAVDALRTSGAVVEGALVIVDRGASRRLREEGVTLYSVATLKEVLEALRAMGVYEDRMIEDALREVAQGG